MVVGKQQRKRSSPSSPPAVPQSRGMGCMTRVNVEGLVGDYIFMELE
jgi:hypothetical protein